MWIAPAAWSNLAFSTNAMTKPASKATYVAALGHSRGLAFSSFESVTFEADSDAEAKKKANEWVHKNYNLLNNRTWLQVTKGGRGIYSKRLGRRA